MGKNLQKLFSFRTNEELIEKINFIAKFNTRTRNKEIEHLLKKHVIEFEKENGELMKDENGEIKIKERPTLQNVKLSNSKIG